MSYDTIWAHDLGVGDTLLLSYAHGLPHEAVAVVREPDTLRAYWYRYRDRGTYVPVQFADTAARFYARNRGQWQEVARSTVPAAPALDSLQVILSGLYSHRSPWYNVEPKVYYLRLGAQRTFVRDQSARLRSEQALRRLLHLTVPPAASAPGKHRATAQRG